MEEGARVPDKVNTIREVLGYLGRYRGEVFVITIDDSLLEEPLFPLLIRDVVLLHRMGIKVVIVPGARRSIDAALAARDARPRTTRACASPPRMTSATR
jgi:acetylglutamate kinase